MATERYKYFLFVTVESLAGSDTGHLKNAVTEVEGMLTSLIYSV